MTRRAPVPPRPTLLLVDDNAGMRSFIRGLMAPFADIHECAAGGEAVDLFETLRPDGVLMDIRMGAMDGIEATRRIRVIDPEARVIIVTEAGGRAVMRAATQAGACEFVSKEDLMTLPDLVRRHVPPPRAGLSDEERTP